MFKKLLCKPQRWLGCLAGTTLLALASLSGQAQTTTVFSEDFEGTGNSFTLITGTQPNPWVVAGTGGNGPTSPGTQAAYISNDGGVTNAYTITSASVVHLYRDVTLPAGQPAIELNFDWRAVGEGANDYLLVQVAPPAFSPRRAPFRPPPASRCWRSSICKQRLSALLLCCRPAWRAPRSASFLRGATMPAAAPSRRPWSITSR